LALLLIWGPRTWVGVWVGAFFAHAIALFRNEPHLEYEVTLITGFVIATGATLQALLGSWLIRRWTGTTNPFHRATDVVKFAFIAAVSVLVNSAIGTTSLVFAEFLPISNFAYTWWTFWMGDLAGVILFAPLLITWSCRKHRIRTWKQICEAISLFAIQLLLGLMIFGNIYEIRRYLYPYALISFLVWAAFRLGQLGVTLSALVVAAAGIWSIVQGTSPFLGPTLNDSLLILQIYIGVLVLTGLILGAALLERRENEEELREHRDHLDEMVQLRTEQLARQTERLQELATLTDLGNFLIRDMDGRIIYWSRGAEQAYGYSKQEAHGKVGYELLKTKFSIPVEEIYKQLMESGRWEGELTHCHKDGTCTATASVWVLHRDAAGKPIAVLQVNTDIQNLRDTQEELRKARDQLELRVQERTAELQSTVEELRRSNEDLERYAYISSHDLQEPLRMISLYVELLEHRYKGQLDPKAQEYIAFAAEGAQRMSRLIKDLLEYSRVNTQGKTLSNVDSETVLNHALKNLTLQIEQTRAQISHDPLPAVLADATQLVQVFQNLLSNAMKFSSNDRPPKIHIQAREEGDRWVFSIKDNGIGIDPQFHDKIFVIFQRLHADRSKYPGTGIGLAIVKRIIERHGGTIWVESATNEGATFYFTLKHAV